MDYLLLASCVCGVADDVLAGHPFMYVCEMASKSDVFVRWMLTFCPFASDLTTPQVAGLVVLHAGSLQDRTQPRLEFFPENKHGWLGELKANSAKL